MNGTLGEQIRRRLMPALEKYQGFTGTYARGGAPGAPGRLCELTAIPSRPEWLSDSEQGAALLQWKGLVFAVSTEAWARTGLGEPELGDRFTVVLGDGLPQTYALLPPKGMRPYSMSAESGSYFLNMKLVSA